MKEFDEAQSTNEYLTGELILARQANEIMTENNRRLERLLIKTIQDLHNEEDLLGALEKNDLFLKKIGKTVRKIFVNFESKLPIDKIIFFYGISNFKERLLLYLP